MQQVLHNFLHDFWDTFCETFWMFHQVQGCVTEDQGHGLTLLYFLINYNDLMKGGQ